MAWKPYEQKCTAVARSQPLVAHEERLDPAGDQPSCEVGTKEQGPEPGEHADALPDPQRSGGNLIRHKLGGRRSQLLYYTGTLARYVDMLRAGDQPG
jgi:hypothetical protein